MSNIYYIYSGTTINLDREIGRGGEGACYLIHGYPSDVAKIYLKQQPPEIHRKILAMVQNPPHDPTVNGPTKHRSIAWPSDILYSDRQKTNFAGFIMPKIDMKVFRKILNYSNPKDRLKTFMGAYTWFHLYTTVYNLASCIAAIHERGYCIGDINESNILVHPRTPLTLIDCDSFQVKDSSSGKIWRCKVGKPEYTAPEILNYKYEDIDRTQETDCFAMGVIIFQLLMEGFHPYAAKGKLVDNSPTTRDKIEKGIFPYTASLRGIEPPSDAPSFDILHYEIKSLFKRCFDSGHKNPSLRPPAKEWMSVLKKLNQDIIKCSINENHRYFNHLSSCPWCERIKKTGIDTFQSPVGLQVQVLDPNNQMISKQEREAYLLTFIEMALMDGYVSPTEEAYLIDQGLKLHIPEKDTKKLIADEIKKKGLPTGIGTPVLHIDKNYIEFKNVKIGSNPYETFEISNIGDGTMTGTISSSVQWIKVPTAIAPNMEHQSQKIQVTIDTSKLPYGFSGSGTVSIKTNGNNANISVSLTTEGLSILLAKFRLSYTPLLTVISGFIFSFISTENLWHVMDIASFTPVPFAVWFMILRIREKGIKSTFERIKLVGLGVLIGAIGGELIVFGILKKTIYPYPHSSGFLMGAYMFGSLAYLLSKQGLEIFLNRGIDLFRWNPLFIRGASIGVVVLAIFIH